MVFACQTDLPDMTSTLCIAHSRGGTLAKGATIWSDRQTGDRQRASTTGQPEDDNKDNRARNLVLRHCVVPKNRVNLQSVQREKLEDLSRSGLLQLKIDVSASVASVLCWLVSFF